MLDINEIKKITINDIHGYNCYNDCHEVDGLKWVSLIFPMTEQMKNHFELLHDLELWGGIDEYDWVSPLYKVDEDRITYEIEGNNGFYIVDEDLKCDYLDNLVKAKSKELYPKYFD